MTWVCYIGIELSAHVQYALLGIEAVMLVALSVVALGRVWTGHGAPIAPDFFAGRVLRRDTPTPEVTKEV